MFASSTHVGRIIISVVCSLQLFDRERCVLPCIVWRQLPQEAGLRLFRGPASGVSWAAWKEGPHCLPAVFLHWIWWEHETISNYGMEQLSLSYLCDEPRFDAAPSPDTYIQKTKKSYIDSRARRNLGSINTELQDVQRIMVANIEEVLQRGEALSGMSKCSELWMWHHVHLYTCPPLFSFLDPPTSPLCPAALDSKASNLSSLSKKYRSDAKYLNTRSTYAKLAAGGVFFIMLIVYVRFWWLWRGKLEAREVSKWRVSWTESEDATKFNPQP